jgi:hypothetical protein
MKDITPAKRALAVLDDAPLPAAADRPKRISKKITAAIDLMVSGDCKKITEAAEKVGLASPRKPKPSPQQAPCRRAHAPEGFAVAGDCRNPRRRH